MYKSLPVRASKGTDGYRRRRVCRECGFGGQDLSWWTIELTDRDALERELARRGQTLEELLAAHVRPRTHT